MKQQKFCDKNLNLFLNFQLSNLPNPKIQFYIGGGIWVYALRKIITTKKINKKCPNLFRDNQVSN